MTLLKFDGSADFVGFSSSLLLLLAQGFSASRRMRGVFVWKYKMGHDEFGEILRLNVHPLCFAQQIDGHDLVFDS